jgi:6-pyruvoyltetrahydropterin/6-carboxytetrahydropterin synthase
VDDYADYIHYTYNSLRERGFVELTLYTEGFFDSAHYIKGYDGKCAAMHGHTWKLAVWIKGEDSLLDATGILWDFGTIKNIVSYFDHKTLNDLLPNEPTAERLVMFIYNKLKTDKPKLLFKVRVYENVVSKTSYCEGGDF